MKLEMAMIFLEITKDKSNKRKNKQTGLYEN